MATNMGQGFNFHADTPYGYWKRAKEYRLNHNYQAAEDVLRKGVEQFPNNARLWSELGKRLARDGRIDRDDEAMECLERSYALAPNDPLIACDYAAFLFKKGYAEESEITYLRAYDDEKEMRWQNSRVLCGLGDIYQKMGQYDYATLCFGRSCIIDKHDDFSTRRFSEIILLSGENYSDQGWDAYLDYAQDLINKAGPAPEPQTNDPAP